MKVLYNWLTTAVVLLMIDRDAYAIWLAGIMAERPDWLPAVYRYSAKDLEERRRKISMLSTLSDPSRRTSCVSAVSSLQLDPPLPLRRLSAAATPPPPFRQSTADTRASTTLVQRRPQQNQVQVNLGSK
jgi:hypothetical protein